MIGPEGLISENPHLVKTSDISFCKNNYSCSITSYQLSTSEASFNIFCTFVSTLKTKMHSSRMLKFSIQGVSVQGDRDPHGQRPPWTETPMDRDPLGQRPPWTETPSWTKTLTLTLISQTGSDIIQRE